MRGFNGFANAPAAAAQAAAANGQTAQGTPQGARVVGPVLGYYSDLASGYLYPERTRIENLQFRVRIDPAGQITYQTPSIQVVSNYNWTIRRIAGFAMNPTALGNAPALINFNLEEQGRSFTVFKTPVSFASVMSASGAGNLAEFDGVYICVPGTQFQVNWTIESQRWASLVGASREVGIQIIGDLVSCRSDS